MRWTVADNPKTVKPTISSITNAPFGPHGAFAICLMVNLVPTEHLLYVERSVGTKRSISLIPNGRFGPHGALFKEEMPYFILIALLTGFISLDGSCSAVSIYEYLIPDKQLLIKI